MACTLRFRGAGAAHGDHHQNSGETIMNRALGLVEPTDSGILEDLFKKITRDGEKRLMLAVLENATEDFQKYVLATDQRGKQLFQDAEEWILDTDTSSLFSFDTICNHLELDPTYMRQGLMHWKAARQNGQSKQCFKSASRRVS
jgi:hypothetical protein